MAVLVLLLASGCGTPVSVEQIDARAVHRELTGNVLSTGELSDFTQNLLRLGALDWQGVNGAEAARRLLHDAFVDGIGGPNLLFALAELSFKHAADGGGRPYYFAAAVYSFAYLFPEGAGEPPSPFDPRFRWAVDIYNRSITKAFETADGTGVELRPGIYRLPFGQIDVAFESASLVWSDRRLTGFVPAAELAIHGLRNRYRRPGLGAPLAAATVPLRPTRGFQVAPRVRVPVTAILRIGDARRHLADGRLHASLELYDALGPDRDILIAGRAVPLESEPTASLAYALSDPYLWQTELSGFLRGDILKGNPSRLVALQPHQPGRFAVVFVHGTASSAGRWADMLNDLLSDPRIRNRFEFWFFSYETGNPIPYSALQLRQTLEQAIAALDPKGRDAALRNMVVIGHSQGGLLAKMTAVDAGSRLWDAFSRKPLSALKMEPETRDLAQHALFVEPEPFVGRVIFIATPHRGSYLAEYSVSNLLERLVRLPGNLLRATGDLFANNPGALRFDPRRVHIGSLYGMTPRSPFINGLAAIPVAPGIPVHSIIAVQGDGPVEDGSDGVVRYKSAHIDGVESELVIRSGHSVQGNPKAVLEVRRILLLHAEEACRQQGLGCEESPAVVSVAE